MHCIYYTVCVCVCVYIYICMYVCNIYSLPGIHICKYILKYIFGDTLLINLITHPNKIFLELNNELCNCWDTEYKHL